MIHCIMCKKIFKTESGTILYPISRARVCVPCSEMMFIYIYNNGVE